METLFLLQSVKYGFLLSFLYDLLRIVRKIIPHSGGLVAFEDLCFWFYTGVKVFLMMQQMYNGSIRWFAILGGLFGIWIYCKLLSPLLMKLIDCVLDKLRRIWNRVQQKNQKRIRAIRDFWRKKLGRVLRPVIRLRYHMERKLYEGRLQLKKKLTELRKLLKMTL